MALELNECPTCGGTITIDREKKTGFCKYCGREFFFDETVNNYNNTNNYYNTNNITADNVTLQNAKTSLQDLIEKEKIYKRLGDVMKLREVYGDMTDLYPSNYRGWWGNICIATNDFSNVDIDDRSLDNVKKWFSLVEDYAPNDVFPELKGKYSIYVEKCIVSTKIKELEKKVLDDERRLDEMNRALKYYKQSLGQQKEHDREKSKAKKSIIITTVLLMIGIFLIIFVIKGMLGCFLAIIIFIVYIIVLIKNLTQFLEIKKGVISTKKGVISNDVQGRIDEYALKQQELSNLIEAQKNELAELNKKLISLNNVK